MNFKAEATLDMLAAIFVLFSAMFEPRISAGLAVIFLIVLAIYKSGLLRPKHR